MFQIKKVTLGKKLNFFSASLFENFILRFLLNVSKWKLPPLLFPKVSANSRVFTKMLEFRKTHTKVKEMWE